LTKPGNQYEKSTEYTNLEYYLNKLVEAKITKQCTTGGTVLGTEEGKYVIGETALVPTFSDAASVRSSVIYDITGVPVAESDDEAAALRRLPAGMYIINGKKVVIR
jgi:hypothetical protein